MPMTTPTNTPHAPQYPSVTRKPKNHVDAPKIADEISKPYTEIFLVARNKAQGKRTKIHTPRANVAATLKYSSAFTETHASPATYKAEKKKSVAAPAIPASTIPTFFNACIVVLLVLAAASTHFRHLGGGVGAVKARNFSRQHNVKFVHLFLLIA